MNFNMANTEAPQRLANCAHKESACAVPEAECMSGSGWLHRHCVISPCEADVAGHIWTSRAETKRGMISNHRPIPEGSH